MIAEQAITSKAEKTNKLLSPAYSGRVSHQFFTHSAHAPATILILEWLMVGSGYFAKPDGYILFFVALAQAGWLAHQRAANALGIFIGNLLGVALYSLVESLIEGAQFFSEPQHIAYWIISVSFALVQTARQKCRTEQIGQALLLIESIGRAAIPVMLYAVFEARSKQETLNLNGFFADEAHVYLTIIVLLLGVLLGFADITLQQTQSALRAMAQRLHQLSSWGFGAHIVEAALQDADRISLKRQERSLLFMDIRGFTAWSERQSPEDVVAMLNAYYAACEAVLQSLVPIKIKFTADEVMAVFADPQGCFNAAETLHASVTRILRPYGLNVGTGLHAGPVIEGLLGSSSVKAYEVIGDTVNTASRICSAAGPGELLVSEKSMPGLTSPNLPLKQIQVKGKQATLAVRVVVGDKALLLPKDKTNTASLV